MWKVDLDFGMHVNCEVWNVYLCLVLLYCIDLLYTVTVVVEKKEVIFWRVGWMAGAWIWMVVSLPHIYAAGIGKVELGEPISVWLTEGPNFKFVLVEKLVNIYI